MLIYRQAQLEDAISLAPRLRPVDLAEVIASSGKSGEDVLVESFRASEHCQVATQDGLVVMIYGAAKYSETQCIPWMLASPEMERYGIQLVRKGRALVALMEARYSMMFNYVHAENHKSIRWLQAIGFEIKPAVPYGHSQELFHPFIRVRHV